VRSKYYDIDQVASSIPFDPPADCCIDATDIQGAIEQILKVGKLISIKMDGNGVIGICDLVEWHDGEIKYFSKVVV
jgi:hypothetical protein